MSDHGILPNKSISPAERAVKYTLDVLLSHPELAWFLVGTETLHQLLTAEVHRLGLEGDAARTFAREYTARLDTCDPSTFQRILCPNCNETLTECPHCGADVDSDAWEVMQ